jgi:hypothetical protein
VALARGLRMVQRSRVFAEEDELPGCPLHAVLHRTNRCIPFGQNAFKRKPCADTLVLRKQPLTQARCDLTNEQ